MRRVAIIVLCNGDWILVIFASCCADLSFVGCGQEIALTGCRPRTCRARSPSRLSWARILHALDQRRRIFVLPRRNVCSAICDFSVCHRTPEATVYRRGGDLSATI